MVYCAGSCNGQRAQPTSSLHLQSQKENDYKMGDTHTSNKGFEGAGQPGRVQLGLGMEQRAN